MASAKCGSMRPALTVNYDIRLHIRSDGCDLRLGRIRRPWRIGNPINGDDLLSGHRRNRCRSGEDHRFRCAPRRGRSKCQKADQHKQGRSRRDPGAQQAAAIHEIGSAPPTAAALRYQGVDVGLIEIQRLREVGNRYVERVLMSQPMQPHHLLRFLPRNALLVAEHETTLPVRPRKSSQKTYVNGSGTWVPVWADRSPASRISWASRLIAALQNPVSSSPVVRQ